MKNVNLIESKIWVDHIHMYVAIPSKIGVADFMLYFKGESALIFLDIHPELENRMEQLSSLGDRILCFDSSNVNEESIMNYIREQEENDKLEDNIT